MGNTPSKIPEPAVAETLRDRLRALEIKETKATGPEVEKGYVFVADQERMESVLEIVPDFNTPLKTIHSSSPVTNFSGSVHSNGPRMGKGFITGSKGTNTSPETKSAQDSQSLSRIVLRCPLYRPTPPPRSSPNAPQRSPTRKPSTSRSRSKVLPSPTSELPGDVGSSPPPMSFA